MEGVSEDVPHRIETQEPQGGWLKWVDWSEGYYVTGEPFLRRIGVSYR